MAERAGAQGWDDFWDKVIEDGKVVPPQPLTEIQAEALHSLAAKDGEVDLGMLGRLRAKGMVSGREAITDLGGEATIIRAREIGRLPREPLAVGTVFHVATLSAADGIAKVEARRVAHRRAAAFRGRREADRLPVYRDDRGDWWLGVEGEPFGRIDRNRDAAPYPYHRDLGKTLVEVHVRAFLDRAAAFAHLRGALEEMARSVDLCERALAPDEAA